MLIGISIYGFSQNLQCGDLLFVSEEQSDFSKAITSATGDTLYINFIHVAIFNNPDSVIEATPKYGVRVVSLDEFLNAAPKINGKPGVEAKRVKYEFPINSSISQALNHLGESYDWNFLPDNGKMYCSELVYECYRDNHGDHLFKSQPMNFRNTDGSMPQFWTELFEKLGEPIPEGMPGTNPNDMSKEEILIEVFRYF